MWTYSESLLTLLNSSSTLCHKATISFFKDSSPTHYPADTRKGLNTLQQRPLPLACPAPLVPRPPADGEESRAKSTPRGRTRAPGQASASHDRLPFTPPVQTPLLIPCGRPRAGSRARPGPKAAGLAPRRPSRFPSSPLPAPHRPQRHQQPLL